MNGRIFFWNIIVRLTLILLTSMLFVWFAQTLAEEFLFTLVVGIFLIVLQVLLLTRYVLGIARVMEQFIDAVGKEEIPEIQFGSGQKLFQKLMERSNLIKKTMNARRLEKEKVDRILIHVINSADLGLFCFTSQGKVLFVNESARALISKQHLFHMDEIKESNEKLWLAMNEMKPGIPRVLRLGRDDQLLSLRLKEVRIFDEYYRLFSLQNIQEELHKNESDSWQKIIRVLTHEIMNAVAPMLSLSKSLQKKIQAEPGKEAEKVMDGLRMIETTGQGLIEFIEEYRRLSLLPPPKKQTLRVKNSLEGVEIFADPHQFEMILLNLLRNSFEAFSDRQQGKAVSIRVLEQEKRVHIKVGDNGSGIDNELMDQVFVPFFSTKEKGSGIGLSLVRQVMNKHEGSIQLESVPGEGTSISLVF